MRISICVAAGLWGLLFVSASGDEPKGEKLPADLAAKAKALIEANPKSEAAQMADAIMKGSQLGPGEGWFRTPAQKKFDWVWFAKLHGLPVEAPEPPTGVAKSAPAPGQGSRGETAGVSRKEFKGSGELFDVLDRDGDGKIRADDFDWSPQAPFLRQTSMAGAVFRPADTDGDGRVTAEEWNAMFAQAGGQPLSQEGIRQLLFPKPPAGAGRQNDGPTPAVLLKGLFAGEIGATNEGPNVGVEAPRFTLVNGSDGQKIALADQLGKRPLVLVFGNFSCGPFRSWSQTLAELATKYQERANFLGVYVREAHPTDGWRMESNDKVGVQYPQPTDFPGRLQVAKRCETTLKLRFPLLVDGLNDEVGQAYSGMPARLYVLDPAGVITYKSARGPFGFRPTEMEQALALTLLATQNAAK